MQKFIRSETGSLSVEAVLMIPMLFFALTGMFVFFDAYQIRNTTGKAGYTIADMLSRETFPINQTYLDDTRSVFAFLARSDVNSRLRVSLVRCVADCEEDDRTLALDWSKTSGSLSPLMDVDLTQPAYLTRIPTLPLGGRIVLVETEVDYNPIFNVGLTEMTFRDTVATRLRFAPRLCWESCVGS
ncbi:TadE/TadG family type IV pilus assembly protein [Yoonia sp.]|uniref:TadE/TadG family type IV pilus assembly protein n=1 Tax=Yoonia sp. TaxID=2212373 RepID=UPI00391AB355